VNRDGIPARRRVPRMPGPERPPDEHVPFRVAVAHALPMLVTLALAAVAGGPAWPVQEGAIPAGFVMVLAVQLLGVTLSRGVAARRVRRAWWMTIACTAMLLPTLALQVSVSRTPFVSLRSGSAGPLVWITLGALLLIACMLVWVGSVTWRQPSVAPLLWLPAPLLVPAVVGVQQGDIDEQAALRALAVAMAFAAAGVIVGETAGPGLRMPIAAGAVMIEVGLLFALGRGPIFAPEHGAVAPLMALVLLLATLGSIVASPVAAVAAGRFVQMVTAPAAALGGAKAGAASDRRPFA